MIDTEKVISYLRAELDLKEKTIYFLRIIYRNINKELPDLTQFAFTDYINNLLQNRSRTTVNSRIVAFNHYVDYLDYYRIPHDLRKMRTKKVKSTPVQQFLSAQQIRDIAEARVPYRFERDYLNEVMYAFWMFLGYTGCRVSEAINLLTKDTDLNGQTATLRDRKNGEDLIINLSDEITSILKKLPKGVEHVFTNTKGKKLDPTTVREDIKIRAKLANVPPEIDVHPHILRHSFVSLILNSDENVPLEKIGKMTGHANLATLYKVYSHLLNKSLRDIVNYVHPLAKDYLTPEQIIKIDLARIQKMRSFNDPRILARVSVGGHSMEITAAVK